MYYYTDKQHFLDSWVQIDNDNLKVIIRNAIEKEGIDIPKISNNLKFKFTEDLAGKISCNVSWRKRL